MRVLTFLRSPTVACVLAAASAMAGAQPAAAPLALRSLAATCAQCHGTDGRPVPGSLVPALAGRPADDTARQMQAFRSGSASGTVMPQLAKGYSEAQVRSLAAYFAAQPR